MAIFEMVDDEAESKRHYFAIQNLSKELKVPIEILTQSYEKTLKEIQKNAKVKDFIVLVVMHDVREILKEKTSF